MTKVTQVHSHGPDDKYLRTVIPVKVSESLDIHKGNAVLWETLDKDSVVLRVVGR